MFLSWNLLILVACYVTFLTTRAFKNQNYFFASVIAITNIVLIIVAIIKKKYRHKTMSTIKQNTSEISESDIRKFYSTVRLVVFGIVILFVVLNLNLSEIRGKKDASVKHKFLVLTNSPSTIIIRAYSDRLICKEFDYKSKKFTNKIMLIKISDNNQLLMELKEL
jgi:asparagine N-glycosylation enzyme membrane subunit Stt3